MLISSLTLSTRALATELKAKDWYASLRQEGVLAESFPLRILFLRQEGDSYKPMAIDAKAFQALSYMEVIDFRELQYFELLNSPAIKTMTVPKNRDELFARWMKLSYTDTIVLDQPDEKRWLVFHKDKEGQAKRIFKGRAPDSLDPHAIHRWLLDKIGYSAVVLRAKGNFFFILHLSRALPVIQALAIENSAGDFLIPAERIKGSALLQLLDKWEDFGIYEGVLVKESDTSKIVRGTKLILAKPSAQAP